MSLDLSKKNCHIMGILNVTPDSFYDGGQYTSLDSILLYVEDMITSGVDILDIGGESSRPGSKRISIQEEIDRILPVVKAIRERFDIPISIDSMKPEVVEILLPYNIEIINDISALSNSNYIDIIKKNNNYICLMHMLDNPEIMQKKPSYINVLQEVSEYLSERVNYCESHQIPKEKIIIDPGFGFGKTLNHNYNLLNNLESLVSVNKNILIGISRKSMIGSLLNKELDKRLNGSLAASVIAVINKAKILRTHDVKQTKCMLDFVEKIIGKVS